jgi:hypothetical protein
MACGTSAHALTQGNSGSLFLTLWNETPGAQQTYFLEVGRINTFNYSSATDLTFALSGNPFAAGVAPQLRWNVVASDTNGGPGAPGNPVSVVFSSNQTLSSFDTDNSGVSAIAAAVDNYALLLSPAFGGTSGSTPAAFTGAGYGGDSATWSSNIGASLPPGIFNMQTGLGSIGFVGYSASGDAGPSDLPDVTTFGNALGAAKWVLEVNGQGALQLRYDVVEQVVPEVPEPSTWALMIAGLLGLGAIARRRKA